MFSFFLYFCIEDRSSENEQHLKKQISFEEDLQLNNCKMLFMRIHCELPKPWWEHRYLTNMDLQVCTPWIRNFSLFRFSALKNPWSILIVQSQHLISKIPTIPIGFWKKISENEPEKKSKLFNLWTTRLTKPHKASTAEYAPKKRLKSEWKRTDTILIEQETQSVKMGENIGAS